ncbi:hypothetical protein GOP47_0017148 [Adiantum capillus-veneris]|uniref:Pentatricopeptide repeat-containing protein n=1 Tax=Adiantum capillus-veneris TaxID=13818 RepID=A0A9D4UJ08_ADICA|nr:hypothetical protein GOP47_0017148 [Adiantum capillus-veneris]
MRSILDSTVLPFAVVNVGAALPTTRAEERLAYPSIDKLDILWRDFFKNPSHWIDIRSTKTDPRSPDFKYKATENPVWVFGWPNPYWVQEKLTRRGLKAPDVALNTKDGCVPVELESSPATEEEVQTYCQMQDGHFLHQNAQCVTSQSNCRTTVNAEHFDEQSANVAINNAPQNNEGYTHACAALDTSIKACADQGVAEQFEEPSMDGVINNVLQNNAGDRSACIALVTSLKACADQGDLLGGISLHTDIARQGLLESNHIIGGAVINMYAKCGALSKAQEVFDVLPTCSVVSWNALLAGYAQNGQGQNALVCFDRMQKEGVYPDAVTAVCILNACGSVGALDKGQELHAFIVKEGLLDINVVVGNALIDMYACCQLLAKAQAVFFELPSCNEVSWTTLITGFVKHGLGDEAIKCFELMKLKGFSLVMATCLSILKACAISCAVNKGQEIHAVLVKDGLLGDSMVIGTALVDMYAKCGALGKALTIFHELPMQDVVAWGALLDGYSQYRDSEEAIQCYEEMRKGGFCPDGATYICILQASGSVGAARKGQEIHAEVAAEGWFDKDAGVANSVIDMYAKCGMLAEAQDVFDELLVRSVIMWNALLAGYAQLGEEAVVSRLFTKMVAEGTEPDFVTFIIVLGACSHRGLLSKGEAQFESMILDYGIDPISEHLTCVVDLFGRAGHINKAIAVVKAMPVSADMSALLAVLDACKKMGNLNLGSWALEHTLHLDIKHSAAYVCVSDIYASVGKLEDVEETEGFNV